MDKRNIYVVVPAYNEEEVIRDTLRKLKDEGYQNIVVVDDGSRDNTCNIAREEGVILCRHVINRGLGGALGTGIKCALEYNPEVIVTFDADGQHDPKDIEKVVEPILYQGYDMVVGSRLMDREELKNMPVVKRVGNRILNIITYLFGGYLVTDSQSGLRAFSRRAAEVILSNLKSNRYEVSSEFIIIAKRENLKFKEVPIKTIYTEYSMSRGTNIITGIKILIKLIIQRLM